MTEMQLSDGGIPDFEPLKDWEFQALKRDIAKHGVLVPIEFDQNGDVVDGHHRIKVCEELGITDYPRRTKHYPSEEAKRLIAVVLNTRRRHLSPPAKARWYREANQLQLELGEISPDEVIAPPEKAKAKQKEEAEHASARQREHRLQELIRPLNPLTANADPWLVAAEALDEIETIRPYLKQLRGPIKSLEAVAEALRQLAWGPE